MSENGAWIAGIPRPGMVPAMAGLGWCPAKELSPEGQELRLLRGGSWFSVPHFCRSAFRISIHPALLLVDVGFRVCCLPPGLPSWSFNP
jgi:formylglycine-generating enzyme required for sulfatase activity